MILYLLAISVLGLLSFLPAGVIPNLPGFVGDAITFIIGIIDDGGVLLGLFVDFKVVITLVGLVMAVFAFEHTYSIIMWILSKIPMLNIRK